MKLIPQDSDKEGIKTVNATRTLPTMPATTPIGFRPLRFINRPAVMPPTAALEALIIIRMDPVLVVIENSFRQKEITNVVMAAAPATSIVPTRQAAADLLEKVCLQPAKIGACTT